MGSTRVGFTGTRMTYDNDRDRAATIRSDWIWMDPIRPGRRITAAATGVDEDDVGVTDGK